MPFCFISCYLHNFPTNHWRDNYPNSNRSPHVSCSGCECEASQSSSRAVTSGDTWAELGCWLLANYFITISFIPGTRSRVQLSFSSRDSGEPGSRPPLQLELLIILYWVWALGCCCCWPGHQPSCRPITARRHHPALPLAGGVPPGRRVAARRWRRTRPPVAGLGSCGSVCRVEQWRQEPVCASGEETLVTSSQWPLQTLLLTSHTRPQHSQLRWAGRGALLRQHAQRGRLGLGVGPPGQVPDGAAAAGHARLRPLPLTLRQPRPGVPGQRAPPGRVPLPAHARPELLRLPPPRLPLQSVPRTQRR